MRGDLLLGECYRHKRFEWHLLIKGGDACLLNGECTFLVHGRANLNSHFIDFVGY